MITESGTSGEKRPFRHRTGYSLAESCLTRRRAVQGGDGSCGDFEKSCGLGSEEKDLARLEGLAKEMISQDKGEMSWL